MHCIFGYLYIIPHCPELFLMLQCGDTIQIRNRNSATPLVIQWLRLCILIAKGPHSIPGGLPGDSVVKNPPVNAGDVGSIPGSERSPRRGNGKPFQYYCLGNPMDRGAWWAAVCRVIKNQAQLSDRTTTS